MAEGTTSDGSSNFSGSCGGAEAPEVYFSWTAPTTDTYVFDTIGSDLDTILYLREGACHGPELACNHRAFGNERLDTPIPYQSALRRTVEEGETLVIVVDGADAEGDFQLNVGGVGASCPDERLEQSIGEGVAEGNNEAQPLRFFATCAGSARDFVYTWIAPEAGDYVIDTNGSDYDTVLFVQSGHCVDQEIACNDDANDLLSEVTLEGVQGDDAFTIIVGGFRGRTGDHVLNIRRR